MAQAPVSQTIQQIIIEQAKKVFEAHKEPIDKTMDKKLIINIAASGSFVDQSHNPYLPRRLKITTRYLQLA